MEIQGRRTCFWAWGTWRKDLIKEAENEQVTGGEIVFGSFS